MKHGVYACLSVCVKMDFFFTSFYYIRVKNSLDEVFKCLKEKSLKIPCVIEGSCVFFFFFICFCYIYIYIYIYIYRGFC